MELDYQSGGLQNLISSCNTHPYPYHYHYHHGLREGQRSRNSQIGLRLKLRTWQALSGVPKRRPFLTVPFHFPPGSFPSYLLDLGNHCARFLPSGCSWLPLWPLGFIYLTQGHQGEGVGQGSENTWVLGDNRTRNKGRGPEAGRAHKKLPSGAQARRVLGLFFCAKYICSPSWMSLRPEGQRGLVQATCSTSVRRKFPLGSTCRPGPSSLSKEVNLHTSNLGITFLLSASSLQTSSPSSPGRGFSLGDPEFPTGSWHKTVQPPRDWRSLEEREEDCFPPPLQLPPFLASSSLQAPQVPSSLVPCLLAFLCPSGRLLVGVGKWRRQMGLSVPTLSLGHFSSHISMLGWETVAVRNPQLQLEITRDLPLLLPSA